MKRIRNHFFSRIVAFIAGLAFLNMGFFLAEVRFLNIAKGPLVENVVKLILNTGLEEEREGSSSSEASEKESLLVLQVQIHTANSILISTQVGGRMVNHYRHANHSLTFSPPPDIHQIS